MKLMIASDLHGSAYYCEKMLERWQAEQADKLVLLGDLLYHGPRNDLPERYAPREVIELLTPLAEKILAVCGNCDSEVDQMVLNFPIMAEYAALLLPQGRTLYITHGHKVCKAAPLAFAKGDILLHGHTHIPACEDCGGWQYLNPGSVAIPKEGSAHSYMTLEDGVFYWKDLANGEIYQKWEF